MANNSASNRKNPKVAAPFTSQSLRDRVGHTAFDLWLPASFLITYVMWLIEWYCDGELKTVGDVFAGLVLAVIASAFSFWVIALALAMITVPVVILCSVISRIRNQG